LPKEKEELRMSANETLTEQEVKQLILTFWKLQEEKAHLVDLMEVTAPDLEISMGDFAWHGYRGLEDHQMGSKDQYFDQHFEPRSISVELSGEEATVKSEVQWNARHWTFPAAKSQEIKAIYSHTWKVRRSPDTGKVVVVLNHVDHMRYVEGYEPPKPRKRSTPTSGMRSDAGVQSESRWGPPEYYSGSYVEMEFSAVHIQHAA
jgi:hypothetical protein